MRRHLLAALDTNPQPLTNAVLALAAQVLAEHGTDPKVCVVNPDAWLALFWEASDNGMAQGLRYFEANHRRFELQYTHADVTGFLEVREDTEATGVRMLA